MISSSTPWLVSGGVKRLQATRFDKNPTIDSSSLIGAKGVTDSRRYNDSFLCPDCPQRVGVRGPCDRQFGADVVPITPSGWLMLVAFCCAFCFWVWRVQPHRKCGGGALTPAWKPAPNAPRTKNVGANAPKCKLRPDRVYRVPVPVLLQGTQDRAGQCTVYEYGTARSVVSGIAWTWKFQPIRTKLKSRPCTARIHPVPSPHPRATLGPDESRAALDHQVMKRFMKIAALPAVEFGTANIVATVG